MHVRAQVYKGMLQGSTSVAVKFVRGHSPKEQARFRNEVGILKSLRHTNVVQVHARACLPALALACHVLCLCASCTGMQRRACVAKDLLVADSGDPCSHCVMQEPLVSKGHCALHQTPCELVARGHSFWALQMSLADILCMQSSSASPVHARLRLSPQRLVHSRMAVPVSLSGLA